MGSLFSIRTKCTSSSTLDKKGSSCVSIRVVINNLDVVSRLEHYNNLWQKKFVMDHWKFVIVIWLWRFYLSSSIEHHRLNLPTFSPKSSRISTIYDVFNRHKTILGSCSPASPNLCDEIKRHGWLPRGGQHGQWRGRWHVCDDVSLMTW